MSQDDSNAPSVLIALQNLRKEFQEGAASRTVIDDVNISFYKGEFIVLLGHCRTLGNTRHCAIAQSYLCSNCCFDGSCFRNCRGIDYGWFLPRHRGTVVRPNFAS